MYEELVESSRFCAMGYNGACDGCIFCGKSNDKDGDCYQQLHKAAADAIEKLNSQVESLCETIDLYHKLLGGHPDPRGEDGEPGIKCIDCQMDCQMIGLDMPACTAYVPPKEE